MKSRSLVSMVLTLTLAILPSAGAQEAGVTPNTLQPSATSDPPPATLDAVAWIAGWWEADALGGRAEEIWTPPSAGNMLGMFRLLGDRGAQFFEIMSISEEQASLVLRLKHFHPDLRGWEERDEVLEAPLVKIEENTAYFGGFTFRRTGADALDVYVATRGSDGKTRELHVPYTRKRAELESAGPAGESGEGDAPFDPHRP